MPVLKVRNATNDDWLEVVGIGTFVDVRSYTSFSAAIDAIGSTEKTLLIPNEQAVVANKTVPSNITLKFLQGGSLNIATGVTVTINGHVEAGLYQIFKWTGTGKVVFGAGAIKELYPQWWGAKGDGVTDDTVAIQAAINSLSSGGILLCPPGTYKITSTLHLSTESIKLCSMGKGTIFTAAATVSPIFEINASKIRLSNFQIQGQSVNETTNQLGVEIKVGACMIYDILFSGADALHGLNSAIQINSGEVDENEIFDNQIENLFGTSSGFGYGILAINTDKNIIARNRIIFSSTNGRHHVYLSQGSSHNIVTNNYFEGGTSSAISLYAFPTQTPNRYNLISNNRIRNLTASTGGAIALVDQVSHNLVIGNLIETTSANHGILLWGAETDVTKTPEKNNIVGNTIIGVGLTGIALIGASNNLIHGNIVIDANQSATGNAGMLVAGVDSKPNSICDNISMGTTVPYALKIYAGVTGTRLRGNDLRAGYSGIIEDLGIGTVNADLRKVTYGTAAPTSGTWAVGDRCWNTAPVVGQPKSWVCTVAGTPGTWVSEGNL